MMYSPYIILGQNIFILIFSNRYTPATKKFKNYKKYRGIISKTRGIVEINYKN